jgi:hypothetical protein
MTSLVIAVFRLASVWEVPRRPSALFGSSPNPDKQKAKTVFIRLCLGYQSSAFSFMENTIEPRLEVLQDRICICQTALQSLERTGYVVRTNFRAGTLKGRP